MRWLASFLRGLVLALAVGILVIAGAALLLERSGWLEGRVRRILAARLGDPVDIDSVRLRWLDATLDIEGLSLGGPEARLEHVHVALRGGHGALVRVASVEVEGGRIVLGEALQRRLAAARTVEPGGLPTAELQTSAGLSPTISVRNVVVDLEQPSWGVFPLGTLEGTIGEDARGRRLLTGSVEPAIGVEPPGDAGEPATLRWSGLEIAPGELEVTLACAGLPVRAERLASSSRFDLLRESGLEARLDLEGSARVSIAQAAVLGGELRARLSGGVVHVNGSDAPVEDMALDLEARCAPGRGETVFDAGAWRASLRLGARWRGAVGQAWAVWGTHAGAGLRGRGWLDVRDLPLDEETFGCLQLHQVMDETLTALEPRGRCHLRFGGELPDEGPPSAAVEVVCDGHAGMTYVGWPDLHGKLEGFPMPAEQLEGRLFGLFAPGRASEFQVAIVRARGLHGPEFSSDHEVQASGQIRRPEGAPPGTHGEIILHLAGEHLEIDGGGIPAGLSGLGGTDWIWPTFAPRGGELSFAALLSRHEGELLLGAQINVDLEGVEVTWQDLPLPLSDLHGRLALRFDPRRAFGAAFRMEGRTATSDRLAVVGRLERDPTRPEPVETLEGGLEEIAIEVDNMALRGRDRQALESVLPELAAALEQVAPAGKVDVRLVRSRALDDRDGELVAEITPREVQFSPQAFRVPTRDLRGRVLLDGTRILADEGGAPAPVRVALMPLVGEWPGDVLVGCTARFGGPEEGGSLEVFASGVPPLQRSLVGALQAAFSAPATGYGSLDLAALSVDGRVDVDGRLELGRGAAQPPAAEGLRVHLRDNSFRVAPPSGAGEDTGFGLDHLRGTVVQQGDVLSGSDIRARLGGTPLVLRDARFDLHEDGGYRLEARPAVRGLPLDREHLRFFLDPATVDALVDELGFGGRVDLDDARLVLSGTRDGTGSVELEGAVRPRALHVDFGLPLDVDSASVRVRSLVFEEGQVRAWASVDELYGSLAGRRLADTHLQLTYVEPRLSIFDLEGTLEGGRLADLGQGQTSAGPAFSLDLQQPFRFDLGLRLVDVRVENLLRGLFESEFASRGALSGELRLEGSLDKVREIRGDGALRLSDTTLWSIPVMQALFSQLGFDDTAVFERMRTRFRVRDGAFQMSEMQVYSPLLQLVGSGTLDMEGRLHHDLEVRYSLVDRLGPLTRMVYWVQNNLLRLAVRGDMSRPRIELKGILSVFQSRPPEGRDLPLPALSPLPERF